MTNFDLLDAVNLHDVRRTAEVADRLGVDTAEALKRLREAERAGLVCEDEDESHHVPADFDRQYWRLTDAGWREWERLDAEH